MQNIKVVSLKVKSYKQTRSVTDGQTDGRTDDGQSDPEMVLCFAGAKIIYGSHVSMGVIFIHPTR